MKKHSRTAAGPLPGIESLMRDTIATLCRNRLSFKSRLSVDALIGVSIDDDQILLLTIKDTFQKDPGQCLLPLQSDDSTDNDTIQDGNDEYSDFCPQVESYPGSLSKIAHVEERITSNQLKRKPLDLYGQCSILKKRLKAADVDNSVWKIGHGQSSILKKVTDNTNMTHAQGNAEREGGSRTPVWSAAAGRSFDESRLVVNSEVIQGNCHDYVTATATGSGPRPVGDGSPKFRLQCPIVGGQRVGEGVMVTVSEDAQQVYQADLSGRGRPSARHGQPQVIVLPTPSPATCGRVDDTHVFLVDASELGSDVVTVTTEVENEAVTAVSCIPGVSQIHAANSGGEHHIQEVVEVMATPTVGRTPTDQASTKKARVRRGYDKSVMDLAVHLVREGKLTIRQASMKYSLPKAILASQVARTVEHAGSLRSSMNEEDEDTLEQWILETGRSGDRLTPQDVREKAEEIRRQKTGSTIIAETLGLSWWRTFRKKHPSIKPHIHYPRVKPAFPKQPEYDKSVMEMAVQLVREGKITARQAGRIYNLPRSTLWARVRKPDGGPGPGRPAIMKDEEEDALEEWILDVGSKGRMLNLWEVKDHAKKIVTPNPKGQTITLGHSWWARFRRRHPAVIPFINLISQSRKKVPNLIS